MKDHGAETLTDSFRPKKIDMMGDSRSDDILFGGSIQRHDKTVAAKKVLNKAACPVDSVFEDAHNVHVFVEGNQVWDASMTLTDIDSNNNKFHVIQLLEHDDRQEYYVLNRHGRLGFVGIHHIAKCKGDLTMAKTFFMRKFHEKTHTSWEDRAQFEKVEGMYDLVQRMQTDAAEEQSNETPKEPSLLTPRIQELMKLIFNLDLMKHQLAKMNYDAKKVPLGSLNSTQIKNGYVSLTKIEQILNARIIEPNRKDFTAAESAALTAACNEYYTRIPHSFGTDAPARIELLETLKQEQQLLQMLTDIETAIKAMLLASKSSSTASILDQRYDNLRVDIRSVGHGSGTMKMIKDYLTTNAKAAAGAHTYRHGYNIIEVVDAFELKKNCAFKDLGNKRLLWHGSPVSNFVGILSQGLKIAPPEAPISGYAFGKGIYFSDSPQKSSYYCRADTSHQMGLMVLCEVSLGKIHQSMNHDTSTHKPPAGFDSVHGVSQFQFDPTTHLTWDNDVTVPIGEPIKTGPGLLRHNEFIVYDIEQVRLRYLVHVKFSNRPA